MQKIINKIKFFFDVLIKSLTKFNYYKEILKAKFTFSLKYLFFLFYAISLIGSIFFAGSIGVLVIPKIPSFVASFTSKAQALYPNDLVVTIKSGNVSTNQIEPYHVDSLKSIANFPGFDHILTIDTNATASDIKDEKTAILITKNEVVTTDNNSYKIYPIEKGTNYTLNKNEFNKLIAKISPYLKFIEPLLIALLVLAVLVWPILAGGLLLLGELLYLLIFTAVFFLVVKLLKKKITFKKLYQLTMHGATLPIILGFVVSNLGIQMPFLLGSAILLVFMILVMNQFEK